MAKEEVWCGIHGEPSVFPIEIERSATVRELQEAIYRHERFSEQFQGADAFTADELTLFHARDVNGVWVPEDEKLDQFLEGEVDTSSYRVLKPSWRLQDEGCFGTDPEGLPDEVIHVLVALPFGDDDGSDDDTPQTGSEVYWYLGSREGREITEFVRVRMEEVATEEFSSEQAELMNAQRHNEYDAYVEANLDGVRTSTRFRVRICDASPDSEF